MVVATWLCGCVSMVVFPFLGLSKPAPRPLFLPLLANLAALQVSPHQGSRVLFRVTMSSCEKEFAILGNYGGGRAVYLLCSTFLYSLAVSMEFNCISKNDLVCVYFRDELAYVFVQIT